MNCDAPPTLDVLSFLTTESTALAVPPELVTVKLLGPAVVRTPMVPKSSVGGLMVSIAGIGAATPVPVSCFCASNAVADETVTTANFAPAEAGLNVTVKVQVPAAASASPVQVSLPTTNCASAAATFNRSDVVPPPLVSV